ncbi:MAG: hypothetical protein H6815_00250 [Phycisphaeraceae bacterium]|nr:hypothetical protein [Phycisphaerales bacterium]MCB9858855.1 hypothetical protein [Phycisphaeraceae bacterium]
MNILLYLTIVPIACVGCVIFTAAWCSSNPSKARKYGVYLGGQRNDFK